MNHCGKLARYCRAKTISVLYYKFLLRHVQAALWALQLAMTSQEVLQLALEAEYGQHEQSASTELVHMSADLVAGWNFAAIFFPDGCPEVLRPGLPISRLVDVASSPTWQRLARMPCPLQLTPQPRASPSSLAERSGLPVAIAIGFRRLCKAYRVTANLGFLAENLARSSHVNEGGKAQIDM